MFFVWIDGGVAGAVAVAGVAGAGAGAVAGVVAGVAEVVAGVAGSFPLVPAFPLVKTATLHPKRGGSIPTVNIVGQSQSSMLRRQQGILPL